MVEPRPAILTALALLLPASCAVELAATLPEALARAVAWQPDAVVVDLPADSLGDVRLLKTLGTRPGRGGIVVLADNVEVVLRETATAAVGVVLPKPLSIERLSSAIWVVAGLLPRRLSRPALAAIEYVSHHFADRVGTGAGAAPLAHVAARFQSQTGLTLKRYTSAMRLEAAKHFLATTDDKLTAVAHRSGFYDDSHLCRVFLAAMGMRPGCYRVHARAHFSRELSNAAPIPSSHRS